MQVEKLWERRPPHKASDGKQKCKILTIYFEFDKNVLAECVGRKRVQTGLVQLRCCDTSDQRQGCIQCAFSKIRIGSEGEKALVGFLPEIERP